MGGASGRRRERRFGTDPKIFVRFVAPSAIAAAAALVVPSGRSELAVGIGFLVAIVVAALAASRLTGRLDLLRDWAVRVRRGERASVPLVPAAPDAIDDLSREMGRLVGELGSEVLRLENERDRLEAILAAMVEGVIVIDGHGTILRANQRVLATFGLDPGEGLAGRKLWDLSRDLEFNAVVRDALASQRPAFREVELRGAIHRFLRVTVGPTADGSAWVLVFHDVTETKHLERVRTDFVANVSHELRTPLTAIKGFAETLMSSGFEDRARAAHFVSIIDRQAERLSRLIDDLLILSDLELGKSRIRVSPTMLTESVNEVVELLSEPARRAEITVTSDVSGDLVALCDPDRLAQVVSNLLDNAIKYTPAGGRVSVSGRRSLDGTMVELSVADTGPGIPAEDIPRVAERFYRVDKARAREFGGTGLGLAIVKHIVQAHGGKLAVESRLGVGTTVRVTLPSADADGATVACGTASGAA